MTCKVYRLPRSWWAPAAQQTTVPPDQEAATGTADTSAGDDARGATADDTHGVIQVVIPPALRQPLEAWLAGRGLDLFRMPIDNPDDLPTYGVGIAARQHTGEER